jgi:hypothetical protein
MIPGPPGGQEDMIITEPIVAQRSPRPYVFIPRTVTMATIASAADEIPQLIGWLAERGATPAGPPFLRYNRLRGLRRRALEDRPGLADRGPPGAAAHGAAPSVWVSSLPIWQRDWRGEATAGTVGA